jgi:hypothetical protein
VVKIRIGGVVELQRGKGAGGFRFQGPAAADGSRHSFRFRSADHGGAEAAHQDALLLSESFGHEENDFVTAVDTDQGEAYAGVSGGRFEDGGPGLEDSALLGVEDHAQSGPVFDTASGVEELKLGVDIGGVFRNDAVEVQHGGEPHQLRHIFGDTQAARSSFAGRKGHRSTG